MLRVEEFFDMDALEILRRKSLGRELDEHDSFSWHIALRDGENLLGAARLYRENAETFRLDSVCLAEPEAPESANFREMLFRTLMLKCTAEKPRFVRATPETEDAFYQKFGFRKDGDDLIAETQDLVFPKLCKECANAD